MLCAVVLVAVFILQSHRVHYCQDIVYLCSFVEGLCTYHISTDYDVITYCFGCIHLQTLVN